jgi:predicted aspartyl protease
MHIPKNTDLRHIETGLTAEQRLAALNESKAMKAIKALGNRWLLAKDYDGHYQPELHARGGA